jgi:hypothetical protein
LSWADARHGFHAARRWRAGYPATCFVDLGGRDVAPPPDGAISGPGGAYPFRFHEDVPGIMLNG